MHRVTCKIMFLSVLARNI